MKALVVSLFAFFVFLPGISKAQGELKFVTFSGFVIDGSTDEPLVGAYVTNPRAGKIVQTNSRGYFIMDVFPGDSLVFSFLGFKHHYHIIPRNTGSTYSAVVELSIDSKMLKEVKVYPFRTEEEFKLAFLNMDSPYEEERGIIERNLNASTLQSLARARPMSSMDNYRYALDQQLRHQQNQKFFNENPLLNTTSWINFIQSVKSGELLKGFGDTGGAPVERNTRDRIFRDSKSN